MMHCVPIMYHFRCSSQLYIVYAPWRRQTGEKKSWIKPQYDIIYLMTCAKRNSDQPAQSCRPIRVFAGRIMDCKGSKDSIGGEPDLSSRRCTWPKVHFLTVSDVLTLSSLNKQTTFWNTFLNFFSRKSALIFHANCLLVKADFLGKKVRKKYY